MVELTWNLPRFLAIPAAPQDAVGVDRSEKSVRRDDKCTLRESTTGPVLGAEGPVRPNESTERKTRKALSANIAKASRVKNVDRLEKSADRLAKRRSVAPTENVRPSTSRRRGSNGGPRSAHSVPPSVVVIVIEHCDWQLLPRHVVKDWNTF